MTETQTDSVYRLPASNVSIIRILHFELPTEKNSLLQSDVSVVFLPRCVFDHLSKMLTCLTIFKDTLSKVWRVKSL